jgi:DNA-binding NtrC family response regulator
VPPRTILLVEDEPAVREVVAGILAHSGYEVLVAEDVDVALAHAGSRRGEIDLLLSDVVMPDADGPEVSRRISQLQPGLRVLFMSGYSEAAIAANGVLQPGAAFIQKPFSMADLTDRVRELLASA